MNDAYYPGSGTYSALIVDGENRIACTTSNCSTGGSTENRDWILHADTTYVRSDGETVIGTTNADGLFSFDLTNSFSDDDMPVIWTGLESNWTSSADNCSKWLSSSEDQNGRIGRASAVNPTAISLGQGGCDTLPFLACVEQ